MHACRSRTNLRRAATFVAAIALLIVAGCAELESAAPPKPGPALIDRTLTVDEIDPAVYFRFDDPTDPFREIYSKFRERRAADMADPTKPSPIEPYESVHIARDKPWSNLEDVLPFDWAAISTESPAEAEQLKRAVRARLVFDHPDVKITQLMIGPGGTLPAHAGGSPGFFYVIGGRGEIMVEGQTQTATPGTTVKLHPYDVRRIHAGATEPLKLIWVRWAPNGDQQFIAAGYYLTGANQHIQPQVAVLPQDYEFWGERLSTVPVSQPAAPAARAAMGSHYAAQQGELEKARNRLGGARDLYPDTPVFSHESDSRWIDEEMLKGSGFFWAKDISQLGELLQRWGEVMRLKGFFRARRSDGGWDFNISQMVWGPHSRYVEHSHSIPEFYYMLSGPVEHWIGDQMYTAMPGDIFMTNSYQAHQSRGIVDDLPFRNIGASWAPNGDRDVFDRPFFLVEPPAAQAAGADLGDAPRFH